jgi:ATP-dependent protease HslVU (ClpYQ) ATPase subunit
LRCLTLVYSIKIDDSTEAVIQRMIEAMRKFIREGEDQQEGIQISSVTKRHFQLQIKTLQNAPRDTSKLQQIIKAKERQNEKARHVEDTQRLVTEIEMLKPVLFLVNRDLSSSITTQNH